MLKLIKNDIFGVIKRIKNIDANYLVFYNVKKSRYELYYKMGIKLNLEMVLTSSVLTSKEVKKVLLSRVEKIDKILKEMEEYNTKLEEKENEQLRDELISKTKTLLRVGV